MSIATSRYLIRRMTVADIPAVAEIERESFPTMWPQTAYKRELQRHNLAAYLIVSERAATDDPEGPEQPSPGLGSDQPAPPAAMPEKESGFGGIGRGLRRLFRGSATSEAVSSRQPSKRVLGFVGIWFMVDEAHIVTIAVAEAYRRRGLGETLLIAAIELAQRRAQDVVTLECRASNSGAQALYEKYGFRRVGIRKRYYTDNHEDAVIMTTFPIRTPEYQAEFERLRNAHIARRGAPEIVDPVA